MSFCQTNDKSEYSLLIFFKNTNNHTNKSTKKSREFNSIKFHMFPLLYLQTSYAGIGRMKFASRLFINHNMPSLYEKVPQFERRFFKGHKVYYHRIIWVHIEHIKSR